MDLTGKNSIAFAVKLPIATLKPENTYEPGFPGWKGQLLTF